MQLWSLTTIWPGVCQWNQIGREATLCCIADFSNEAAVHKGYFSTWVGPRLSPLNFASHICHLRIPLISCLRVLNFQHFEIDIALPDYRYEISS